MNPSAKVINISNDEEGVNWDLLEKEIDEEEELEMKRKGGLQGASVLVNNPNRVFASATFPEPYADRRPIPGVVSCHSREEYERFLDSFRGGSLADSFCQLLASHLSQGG